MLDVIICANFGVEKIKGFGKYEGSNFWVSHWNSWSPLQQWCATLWCMWTAAIEIHAISRVCRNSYTGTRTVPDSYSCLCERSLRPDQAGLIASVWCSSLGALPTKYPRPKIRYLVFTYLIGCAASRDVCLHLSPCDISTFISTVIAFVCCTYNFAYF